MVTITWTILMVLATWTGFVGGRGYGSCRQTAKSKTEKEGGLEGSALQRINKATDIGGVVGYGGVADVALQEGHEEVSILDAADGKNKHSVQL